jgi:hypothetical protein
MAIKIVAIKEFLQNNKNEYTKTIDYFEHNLECFLGIPEENRGDKKPLNVMWHYENNKIDSKKLGDFKGKIEKLLAG